MAVIIDDNAAELHMETLAKDLKKHGLPPYARPCFVRLTKNIELTGEENKKKHHRIRKCFSLGTFKVKKTVFQEEGFDLTRIDEPIFYLNQQKQIYERLTAEIFDLIKNDKLRF